MHKDKSEKSLLGHLLNRRLLRLRLLTLPTHELPNNIRVILRNTFSLFSIPLIITRRVAIAFLFQNTKTKILPRISISKPQSPTSHSKTYHLYIALPIILRIIKHQIASSPSLNLPLQILIGILNLRQESIEP